MGFDIEQAKLLAEQMGYSGDIDEFLKGLNVELEHKDLTKGDPVQTAKIALAHLKEDPKYYEKLKKIEVKNARELPGIYYAKHIREGTAYYPLEKEDKQMLLIKDDALKKMMPSFVSKPIFVDHQDVTVVDTEKSADGYITDSFYNELDGCYWVKLLAVSDKIKNAIQSGWSVSNAYDVLKQAPGGTYNKVEYHREVLEAAYNHLAIVPNPRYEWAKIYSPEDFKKYQEEKRTQLEQLQNSKDSNSKRNGGLKMSMLEKLFKKVPVQNADDLDLENTFVVTKDGEKTLAEVLNAVEEDEKQKEENKKNIANGKMKINTKNGEKSVDDLVKHYEENCSKKNEEDEEDEEEKDEDLEKKAEEKNSKKKKNEEDEEKKAEDKEENKKKNSKDEEESKKYFERLKNASEQDSVIKTSPKTYDSSIAQRQRGNSRYGSSK